MSLDAKGTTPPTPNDSARFLTLSTDHPALRDILLGGLYEGKVTLPLRTSVSPSGKEEILFEQLSPSEVQTPNSVLKWFLIVRGYSLTATAAPCLAALLYGVWRGWTVRPGLAIAALLGALLLQVAINILNDVQDHLKLIDLPENFGGSGALQKGWITARRLNRLALACMGLAAALGAPSLLENPTMLFPALLVAGLGVIGYSNPPFGFKYRALGDLAVILLCGPLLTYCYALAVFGTWDLGTLILGTAFGLAAATILHANNLQDIPIDRKRGARTIANTVSFSLARWGLAIFYLGTGVTLALGGALGQLPWAPLFTGLAVLPVATKLARLCLKASGPDSPLLSDLRFKAAKTHLLFGLASCLGLGIAWILR